MSSWSPHAYLTEGLSLGLKEEYLRKLVAEGNRLHSRRLPVLFTLNHLSQICQVPFVFLHQVVKRRDDPYRVFSIRKKGPRPNAGKRYICVPHPFLMQVQRWIHDAILAVPQVSTISTAYAPLCSPRANALAHVGAKWLIKLDIESFFESVSERQVFWVFRNLGYRPLLAFELARLCTRVIPQSNRYYQRRWQAGTRKSGYLKSYWNWKIGSLPQGAPTSPMLANLVCHELDRELETVAADASCAVTRYADDIVFSAGEFTRTRAVGVLAQAQRALTRHGFRTNKRKTTIIPPGARRVVTGLLVDGAKPRLSKEFRSGIELHLYHARTKGVASHCRHVGFLSLEGFRHYLLGLIAFAKSVDQAFAQRCEEEFALVPWGILAGGKF